MRLNICFIIALGFLAASISYAQETSRALSFHEAMQQAAQNNVDVLLAREHMQNVRGHVREAKAEFLPNVYGDVFQYRETTNLAALGFKPGSFPGVGLLLGPYNNFDARISLLQTIFNYGALRAHGAAKSAEREAALEKSLRQQQASLNAGVAYLQLLQSLSNSNGANSDVDLTAHLAQLVKDQHRSGIVTGVDVTRASTQFSLAQSRAIEAETRIEEVELDLKHTIGWPLGTRLTLLDTLESSIDSSAPNIKAGSEELSEQDLRAIFARRLETRVAEEEVYGAKLQGKAALGGQTPTVDVRANYGASGNTPTKNVEGTYLFGAELTVPFYDGGKSSGQRLEALSRQRQAEISLRDLQTQIEQEVRLARHDLKQATEKIGSARQAFELAQKEMSQVQDQFKAGTGDSVDLVTTENSLTRAREDYVLTLTQYQVARLNLAYALGELDGFQL